MIVKANITHVHVRKTGFLTGIIFGIFGLIIGIVDAVFNGVLQGILAPASSFLLPGSGIWGIVLLPVIGFVAGFLLGVMIAELFNLAGKLTGGFEIEMVEKPEN